MSTPWEVSPSLTESRLRTVAAAIFRVRGEVLAVHEPDKGDGNCGFGCRAYERTCFTFAKMASDPAYSEWLGVDAEGGSSLSCTLRIGGVPIKFYRGEPNDPTPRALRGGVSAAVRDAARGQTNLFGLLGHQQVEDSSWFWLMAIETHADGTAARVIVLQATESGDVRNVWEIPQEPAVAVLANVSTVQREGVDLPPPPIGPKPDQAAEGSGPVEAKAVGDDKIDGES